MAETVKKSYLKEVMHFYLAPELRSVATVLYLGVFGYMALYYIDSLFLAFRFLAYVLLGHTALSGVAYLFTGMVFVISLMAPFFISFYAIFILHRVWNRPNWAIYVKWAVTGIIVIGGVFLIIFSDEAARMAARQDAMQGFIEDANLSGRI